MLSLNFDSVIVTPYEDFADDLAEPTNTAPKSNISEFLDSLRFIIPHALVLRETTNNTNKAFQFHSEHNQVLVYFNSNISSLGALPKILKGVRQSAKLEDCVVSNI
jgi:hypothetical protein